jgi:ABC-2 type transport system permease protein
MTAAVAAAARDADAGPASGAGVLLRAGIRIERVRLLVWVLAVGLLTVYAATALTAIYPTVADRQARAAVIGTPAGILLSGPGYGTEAYSLGAMIANELSLSVMVAVAIMSIQLVVRRTRAEEEDGRAELLRAGIVGRLAPLAAGLGVAALADAAVVVVVTAGLVGSGRAAADALVLAVGIGLTGLVFAGVAAMTAQLTEHARAATGTALAVLAVAAVVRGAGDLLRPHGSVLSWFSPLAWPQQTRAFVDLRWTPLLLSAALVVVLAAATYRLAATRDLGAGLLVARPGPAHASRALGGPGALAARLQRGSLVAWAVAMLLLGVVFGSFADDAASLLAGNRQLSEALAARGGGSPADSFLAAISLFLALGVAAFAVGSVLRVRGEEAAGRTELVLATALDRRRYLSASLLVTAGASAVLLLLTGLGTGVSAAVGERDPGMVTASLGAELVHLPAVLVTAAVAAALLGLAPRVAGLAWALVAWAVVVGLFGPLLRLPEWAVRLSPFAWDPSVPAEAARAAPLTGLSVLTVALAAVAVLGFRGRDVPA